MNKTYFMCMTDFDNELGTAKGGVVVYASKSDLREHRKCVDECGIVEVSVEFVRTVQESNFDYE